MGNNNSGSDNGSNGGNQVCHITAVCDKNGVCASKVECNPYHVTVEHERANSNGNGNSGARYSSDKSRTSMGHSRCKP